MLNKVLYLSSKLKNKFKKSCSVKERRKFNPSNYFEEIKSEAIKESNKDLLLSIDDISLKSKTFMTSDNGGDYPSPLYRHLDKLVAIGYKPTFYFVANPLYCYVPDSPSQNSNTYNVTNITSKPELLLYLNKYLDEQLIEVAQHGLTHHNKNLIKYHSFEFDGIDKDEMIYKIKLGKKLLSENFNIYGFKPPAWSVGKLLGNEDDFLSALTGNQYEYVSLSSPTNGLNYDAHNISHIYTASSIGKLKNIPQNISILWDKSYIERIVREINLKKGIINIQIHFQEPSKYLQDGLDDSIVEKLDWIFSLTTSLGYTPKLTRNL